jgi:hypothetical protein
VTTQTNIEAYYDVGRKQAIELFKEQFPRQAKSIHMAMTAEDLRERLRKLPSTTLFNSALADLFAGISQEEGRKRRRSPPPPPNPFKGKKNNLRAAQADIIQWEMQWRQKKVDSLLGQVFMSASLPEVRDYGRLLRSKLLWMVTDGKVMGSVDDLPIELFEQADPSALDVRAWTVEQVLAHRWLDVDEQTLWVERFKAGNRFLEAAIVRQVLALQAEDSDQPNSSPRALPKL